MKILSVDDHSVIRVGLRHLLKGLDKSTELMEACNFDEAKDSVSKTKDLDLILLDLLMPGANWTDGIQELKEVSGNTPIIVLSTVENRQDVLRAIDLGAMGFVPKSAPGNEILKAIRVVLDGDIYLPQSVMGGRDSSLNSRSEGLRENSAELRNAINSLTKRQREVLGLVAEGKTNAEIAKELGKSENTIRIHVSAILKTLQVSNRTKAALLAESVLNT